MKQTPFRLFPLWPAALAAVISACASPSLPSPTSAPPRPLAIGMAELAAGLTPLESDGLVVSLDEAEATRRVPLRYARGTDETVRWTGTGPGVAALVNGYGQLVYQVRQGGPAVRALVPAGDYTLVLGTSDGTAPLISVLPTPTERALERVLESWPAELPAPVVTRAGDRRAELDSRIDGLLEHLLVLTATQTRAQQLHDEAARALATLDDTIRTLRQRRDQLRPSLPAMGHEEHEAFIQLIAQLQLAEAHRAEMARRHALDAELLKAQADNLMQTREALRQAQAERERLR